MGLVFEPVAWPGRLTTRSGPDGVHGVLRAGCRQHRLWWPHDLEAGAIVACVVPLDGHPQAAAAAISAFWHHVRGQQAGCAKAPDKQLRRARLSLVALDGHRDGASYRTLAEQLFGAARVAGETWRTSSLRDATIRLVRTGLALSRSDYRRLVGQKIEA